MSKAEDYLQNRYKMIVDEKHILSAKIQKFQLELDELEMNIEHIKNSQNVVNEIFSPRSKTADYRNEEINKFESKKEEISSKIDQFTDELRLYEDEFIEIEEALASLETKDIGLSKIIEEYGMKVLEQQEKERLRIAGDLHDTTVQVLTNIVHKTELCERLIGLDTIRVKLELEIIGKTIRETINDMRNIIYNLRPIPYEDITFELAIQRTIEQIKKFTNIKFDLQISGEVQQVEHIVTLTLVRIIQECCNNSIKHSKADYINIEIAFDDGFIELKVSDNGVGFNSDILYNKSEYCHNFGLSIMKERIYLLSGQIDINSEVNKGTTIHVRVPVIKRGKISGY